MRCRYDGRIRFRELDVNCHKPAPPKSHANRESTPPCATRALTETIPNSPNSPSSPCIACLTGGRGKCDSQGLCSFEFA
jgi:hypothetical protein